MDFDPVISTGLEAILKGLDSAARSSKVSPRQALTHEAMVLNRVAQLAGQRLAKVKRGLNSLQPFHQLPYELMGKVVQTALNDQPNYRKYYLALLQLKAVSGYWADTIDRTPYLWARASSTFHHDFVEHCLSKSGNTPLELALFGPHSKTTVKRFLDQIWPHWPRWGAVLVDEATYKMVPKFGDVETPKLQRLSLHDSEDSFRKLTKFPSLSHPSNLRHLELKSGIRCTLDLLEQFLAEVSALEILEIDGAAITMEKDRSYDTISLPRLHRLYLSSSNMPLMAYLLTTKSAPKCQVEIKIRNYDHQEANAIVPQLTALIGALGSEREPLEILVRSTGSYLAVKWGAGEVSLRVQNPPPYGSVELLKTIMPRYEGPVHLTIEESEHPSIMPDVLLRNASKSYPNAIKLDFRSKLRWRALRLLTRRERILPPAHLIWMEPEPTDGGWMFPQLSEISVHGSGKENDHFDDLVEVVKARLTAEGVKTLATVVFEDGIVTQKALGALHDMVPTIFSKDMEVVEGEIGFGTKSERSRTEMFFPLD